MPEETHEEEEVADLEEQRGKDLIYAARTGDIDAVKALLAEGVPVGFRDASGWTSLKWASSEGHEEVLVLLLEQGASEEEVEGEDEGTGGGTSLHWAAYKGHKRLVWRLLTCKPKLSAKTLDSEANTPLHLAAAGGHLVILETMLSEGVDVSLKNAYGNTALQLTTSPECQHLLKRAASAALDGRPLLCSCSGEFCSETKSMADTVIDRVSAPTVRPVRYSSECAAQVRAAEDGLTLATRAQNVAQLEEAIKAAEKIGASLPLITEATASLERLQAQIALADATQEIQSNRPLKDRAMLRPIFAPLKLAREKGVAAAITADADSLCQTVDAEVALADVVSQCEQFKMVEPTDESGEPPAGDSDFAKRAEAGIAKLAGAIATAPQGEAMQEVIELGEHHLMDLTAESELRKALLEPKEGLAEDGTTVWTQYNGTKSYSALEDLQFRNDFLDISIEKCIAADTVEPIVAHAQKVQKELKAALKTAQLEDEERKAKEAAAAAKAAKKGKKKK